MLLEQVQLALLELVLLGQLALLELVMGLLMHLDLAQHPNLGRQLVDH